MAEASSRLEVLKSDNICSMLCRVPDNIYILPGFSDVFFFQKSRAKERVQAELKKFRQAAIKGRGKNCL